VLDTESETEIKEKVEAADHYKVNYVGIDLSIDGFAVASVSGDAANFASVIKAVRQVSQRPLVLMSRDAEIMKAGLAELAGENPLIYGADSNNWEAMVDLAKEYKSPLGVIETSLENLADLTQKITANGVEDLVIDPGGRTFSPALTYGTQIRRLSLKNFRPLGYPVICFPGDAGDPGLEAMLAAQAITKYAGFIVIDHFSPDSVYPILVLRKNLYTDPQKPIQVQPGLYEINSPKPEDPLLVTTNFSITYFSVANEVEGAGLPAWLLVTDAEGMSVLTAWAAGKFDAERIAKAVKEFNVADKTSRKQVVLPGHVAVLSGELEEELPGWEIRVGPREAVDLPSFMKQVL
jgi:acetyl-CoA decarbonylase/synthase complex subunit gamma